MRSLFQRQNCPKRSSRVLDADLNEGFLTTVAIVLFICYGTVPLLYLDAF